MCASVQYIKHILEINGLNNILKGKYMIIGSKKIAFGGGGVV